MSTSRRFSARPRPTTGSAPIQIAVGQTVDVELRLEPDGVDGGLQNLDAIVTLNVTAHAVGSVVTLQSRVVQIHG